MTVHHYIEGTITPVPLVDGTQAKDLTATGNKGEAYTTQEISQEELDKNYELVEIPSNSVGTYEYPEIEVTYYYAPIPKSTVTVQ